MSKEKFIVIDNTTNTNYNSLSICSETNLMLTYVYLQQHWQLFAFYLIAKLTNCMTLSVENPQLSCL